MESLTTSLAFAAILTMLSATANAQCDHPLPNAPIVKVPHTSQQKVRRVCTVERAHLAPSFDRRAIANHLKASPPAGWLVWIWPSINHRVR